MKRKPTRTEFKLSKGTSSKNFEKTYKKRIQALKQGIQEILAKKVVSLKESQRLLEELSMVTQGYNELKDKDLEGNCTTGSDGEGPTWFWSLSFQNVR